MDVKTILLLTGVAVGLLALSVRLFSAPLKLALKVLCNTLLGLASQCRSPLHRAFPGTEPVQRGGGWRPGNTRPGTSAAGAVDLYIACSAQFV